MAVYDILPDTNLTGADVRDTLNANGGSVGDNFTSFFTSGANISMWAKFKPNVSPTLFFDLQAWKSNGYRGADGKCGLTILSKKTTMSNFHTYLENGSALWSYTPPKGGRTEPMRMGDFRGYYPKATNPIGLMNTNGYSQNGSANVYGDVEFNIEVLDVSDYNLTYGDIRIGGENGTPLTDYYLGIFAWKSSTQWAYKTNTKPLGQSYDFTIKIPLTTGEWKITPFFCSVSQNGIQEAEGTYVGANVPTKIFNIISTNDMMEFAIQGQWNKAKTKIQNISISVKNNINASVTVKNIAVSLRGIDKYGVDYDAGSPVFVYYKGSSSNTISIPANSTFTTSAGDFGDITLQNPDYLTYSLRATGYVGDKLYTDILDMGNMDEDQPEA